MNRSLKIFVVENHDDTLVYLAKYLEQKGHEVLTATDMASALDHLRSVRTDVLISDIGLPDGDGWQLMSQLDPKPFGIAMSGYGTGADCQKSRASGYKHHLIKPFLPDDLDELLDRAEAELSLSGA